MNSPLFLYIASVLGAVSLLLILPKRSVNWPKLGAVLGAATVGGLWLALSTRLPESLGIAWEQFNYYYVFSGLSIIAAVRVVTHTRPVYAALWFVMVVLASAGLLLTLDAEFIAFAMVIIYGGAILVTYLFVIMLASQQTDSDDPADQPEYDRLAREPIAAVLCGFVLLAVLLNVAFPVGGMERNQNAVAMSDTDTATEVLANRAQAVQIDATAAEIEASEAPGREVTNIERVGLDLFMSHPLGLELAGVILLVSLIGAVVIAKTQVPDEDAVKAGAAPSDPPPGEAGPHTDRGTGNVPDSVSP